MDVTSPLLATRKKESPTFKLQQEYEALGKTKIERKLKAEKKKKSSFYGKDKTLEPPTTALPRNVPRKIIGKIRRKGEKHRQVDLSRKKRIGMYAYSYEFDLQQLHRHVLRRGRSGSGSTFSFDDVIANAQEGLWSKTRSKASYSNEFPSTLAKSWSLHEVFTGKKSVSKDSMNSLSGESNGIDVDQGPFLTAFDINASDWECEVFFDVLHLTKVKPQRPSKLSRNEGVLFKRSNGNVHEESKVPPPYHSDTDNNRDVYIEFDETKLNQQLSDPDHEADDESDYPKERQQYEEKIDVFLFSFGSAVFWNWGNEQQEKLFMESLRPFMIKEIVQQDLLDDANDTMDYIYSSKAGVKHDLVRLSSNAPEEKLAVSYAFAQSNLLSVYEWRLDKIIERNEHIPQQLAQTGKMSLTQDQISREVGRLFMERNSINLASDVLDTPRFFWENDEWDPVYSMMCKYLEHDNRIDVLNRRLDCVHELLEVLQQQAENQHASRLEWIVIWLISCEVFIQVVWNIIIKDILGFFRGSYDI